MGNRLVFAQLKSRQSGVVLFVALILLLILSMIGVTVARLQTVEERMARNEDSRQVAEQAAEAALRNAESLLLSVNPILFLTSTPGYATEYGTSAEPTLNWVAANTLPYNGPPLTNLPLVARTPLILIEELPATTINGNAFNDTSPNMFRITVQAANADGTPSVTLQSIFTLN